MASQNSSYSKVNPETIFQEAETKEQAEHADQEKTKLGNLRGGSSGCIITKGDDDYVIGGCHRMHAARILGISPPASPNSLLHFAQGRAMEEEIARQFGLAWEGAVLQEEETPTCWKTSKGRLVTGRPDIVLVSNDGSTGFEIKTVCSTSTAEAIYFDDKPKTEHLIQASHYSMELGIPFILTYWNGNSLDTTFFMKKRKEHLLPSGKLNFRLKAPPFRISYHLKFDKDGFVCYNNRASGKEKKTEITEAGIREYFELVGECIDKKELGPRVASRDAFGNKMPFDRCKYCDASEACDQTQNFEVWLDMCKALFGTEE